MLYIAITAFLVLVILSLILCDEKKKELFFFLASFSLLIQNGVYRTANFSVNILP